ncbi:MAG: hypothetical protein Q8M23_06710, partial [Bacteroidales bacterium]|nr:hypothetical protein [Bacteroidales bacterium]
WILAGAIGGFAATVKTAGISIGVALAVYLVMGVIVGFIREKSLPVALKQGFYPGWGVLSFVLVFFLISVLFSTKGTQETSTYINIFSLSNLETVVSTNIFNFSETIRTHFIINPYPHGWYGLLLGSAILVFSITGFIMAFIKGPGIIESFVFVYVLLILVYPYHHSGIRFLLPIAPVMLMYSAKVVASFKPANVFKWMVIAGAIVMFIIYLPPIVDSHKSRRTIIEGPYKPEVQTAFNMVQSLTGPEDLIVFLKPRVLAWAIERRCISHHPAAQADEMHKVFHDKGATHFLVYTGLHDPALHVYLSEYKDNFDCIMATDAFTLYRKKI